MSTLDKISKILKEKNLKQKELTDYLGISKNAFTDWKSGRINSYLKHIPKIAEFLGCSSDYLLNNDETITNTNTLSQKEKLLIDNYKQLNEEGREKLLSYSDDLVSSGKYIKSNLTPMDKEA